MRERVFITPNRKFQEQELDQYIGCTQQEICDPPIGDGGSTSVHVASNRVTRDLKAVKKEDVAAANSISESTNFSIWEKGERIGAGGFGTVYVARNSYKKHVVFFIFDRETGVLCAVKELKNIHKPESIQKEIKILSQLEHPNIVKYYGHEEDGNEMSVYMEFIQPGSLKKYILERGALHETLIRKFTAQILAGLVYLQSKRVVHSPPEALRNTKYKSSREASVADIWNLGCVIIEMLSGKHPWPNCEEQQAGWNVVGKGQCPSIPDELCSEGKDFLERCFIRTPAGRPSATELQDHPFVKPQNLSC
ncbi:hypothetical protein K1719_001774 [Acacia pycnantha]|nr:hypothetical protein K1719_001774 [Acacia pycnantha]